MTGNVDGRWFHSFDTDVYGLHVMLCVAEPHKCPAEALDALLKRAWPKLVPADMHLDLDAADEATYADCVTVTSPGGLTFRIVRIPRFGRDDPFDYSILAHETQHLVLKALDDLGVEDGKSHEASAYLFEMVYRRFLEGLFKRKEKRCHQN